MSRTLFNFITAIIIGTITAIAAAILQEAKADYSADAALGLLTAVFTFSLLTESISARLKHILCDLDWAEETVNAYKRIPETYRKSFWYLFGLINLAYLFHTINFMWGGTDWAAVRTAVDTNESLTDGRFSAFWLQELLFNGKILPVANNLWAFLGLSLSGVLLARYWNLPQKTGVIVICGLMIAVNPYALSWLYSAKNTLGILWLPAITLGALLLAEGKAQSPNRTLAKNLISVMLYLLALGAYFPVINFIAVAILGKILLRSVYADVKLKDALIGTRQTFANLTAALMLYIFILLLLEENGILNSPYSLSAPFTACWGNITHLLRMAVGQFATPLPFADLVYQLLFLLLVLTAVFTIIFNAPNTRAALRSLALVPLLIIAAKFSTLFTLEPAESTFYLAQLNFFGLPLLYALMFVVIIRLGGSYTRAAAYGLSVLLIFMSFVRVAYAQKVWKFGWDAETKLAERIITRLEKLPEFDLNRQYKLLQIGEMSLREKYYIKRAKETENGNLLSKSYYPAGNSKDAYNFFYQTDFLSENATKEALKEPAIREYILKSARAWPAKESLWIYGNYIIMVIDDTALTHLQHTLSN